MREPKRKASHARPRRRKFAARRRFGRSHAGLSPGAPSSCPTFWRRRRPWRRQLGQAVAERGGQGLRRLYVPGQKTRQYLAVRAKAFYSRSHRPSRRERRSVPDCLQAAPPLAPASALAPTEPRDARRGTFERRRLACDVLARQSNGDRVLLIVVDLWNIFRDATGCIAAQQEGGQVASAVSARDERPENPTQSLEKVESTARKLLRPASTRRRDASTPAPGRAPGISAQGLEKVQFAPGDSLAPRPGLDPGADRLSQARGDTSRPPTGDERPEYRPQRLEKVESALGVGADWASSWRRRGRKGVTRLFVRRAGDRLGRRGLRREGFDHPVGRRSGDR